MATGRREFLRGAASLGMAAAAGCAALRARPSGAMGGFAAPRLDRLRVGVVGLGMRGPAAVQRLAGIPGVEVAALCDLKSERVRSQSEWLVRHGYGEPREYSGADGWRRLCESELDLVYIATPWELHAAMAVGAMECGKHAAVEVPGVMTLEECWQLVETSERTHRHCVPLENCAYGEAELLCLNLVREGLLGEIMHADCAYIHDLRSLLFLAPESGGYQDRWRLRWNERHGGNAYPTHALVPVMQAMNINRGDRFEYLVSVESAQRSLTEFARARHGVEAARSGYAVGDMSTSLLVTARGHTVSVEHSVTTPRPFSKEHLLQGTRGVFSGHNFVERVEDFFGSGCGVRMAWETQPGDGKAEAWFDFARTAQLRGEYRHPLWREAGALARKVGGHGGMDFIMDLRLCYCLRSALAPDLDVYDLATASALVELSERSARRRGESVEVPDFTGGAWARRSRPAELATVELGELGYDEAAVAAAKEV